MFRFTKMLIRCVFLCLSLHIASSSSRKHAKNHHKGNRYIDTLSWAVQLTENPDSDTANSQETAPDTGQISSTLADTIAKDTGVLNAGRISEFGDHFLLEHHFHQSAVVSLHSLNHRVKNSTGDFPVPDQSELLLHLREFHGIEEEEWREVERKIQERLEAHPNVLWFSQQSIRPRKKRRHITFDDPYYRKQWHLHNTVYSGYDINVTGVWELGVTGRGVTAVVVDDGLEWTNPDIQENYSAEGSYDLNDKDDNPMPSASNDKNHHGTRCAGEIAAVKNSVCAVGVAYEANIAGLRVLDGPMTDSLEADAFTANLDVNEVFSCSWGPDDDGKTVDGPHYLATKALRHGVDYGRGGYGAVYVVASGNGGRYGDNCNYDGYANSVYTLTIGAVDEQNRMPYYAEECASMLAVTYSSGDGYTRNIVTTDWRSRGGTGCTENHSGTSAAAPLAAGIVALMFQARPCLSWRDVQYIVIMAAVKVDVDVAHWQRNAAGLHHSHKHGFGLMDAWRCVNAAKAWESVPWPTTFTSEILREDRQIPASSSSLTLDYRVSDRKIDGYDLFTLEYIQVTVTLTHERRGDLEIKLRCPSGTESMMAASRPHDNSNEGFRDWTFSTVRCWGEKPKGKYTLIVTDKGSSKESRGEFETWKLKLYGTPMTSEDIQQRIDLVKSASDGHYLRENISLPCPPPPVRSPDFSPMSQRILKVLVLSGGFCIFLAVYETFEYLFCYDDEKKLHRRLLKLSQRARELTSSPVPPTEESSRLLDSQSEDTIEMQDISPTNQEPDNNVLFDRTANQEEEARLLVGNSTNEEVEEDSRCHRIAQKFTQGLEQTESQDGCRDTLLYESSS